jgi:hypothetical protein
LPALPATDQRQAHWQTAAEILLMPAEGRGPIMHARIGMLRALNHGKPATPPERRSKGENLSDRRMIRLHFGYSRRLDRLSARGSAFRPAVHSAFGVQRPSLDLLSDRLSRK